MAEASNDVEQSRGDGYHIIELLCQADSLVREELRIQCTHSHSLDIRFLLEAQINISRAIEALYDRVQHN